MSADRLYTLCRVSVNMCSLEFIDYASKTLLTTHKLTQHVSNVLMHPVFFVVIFEKYTRFGVDSGSCKEQNMISFINAYHNDLQDRVRVHRTMLSDSQYLLQS